MVNQEGIKAKELDKQCDIAVEILVKTALNRMSLDNISCIFICLNNYEKLFLHTIPALDNKTLKKILVDLDKQHKEFIKSKTCAKLKSDMKISTIKKIDIINLKKRYFRDYSVLDCKNKKLIVTASGTMIIHKKVSNSIKIEIKDSRINFLISKNIMI